MSSNTYKCRKCRSELFMEKDITLHDTEKHKIKYQKIIKDLRTRNVTGSNVCSAYHLNEILPWMENIDTLEGKIICPLKTCQARLGSFNWSGSQCSCGTWISPSIKLIKSKIDSPQEII